MFNYDEMKENYNIIKEFAKNYRHELMVLGGIISEISSLTSYEDYMKFQKDLNDDEFTGNYLTALLTREPIEKYKEILNGDDSFENFIGTELGIDVYNKFIERV